MRSDDPDVIEIEGPPPLERPAEMVIDTQSLSAELAAHRILVKLESLGFIG